MQLHTPTISAPTLPRLGYLAALAAATFATAGAVIVIADDPPAPQVRAIAEPSQPVATRYFDIEANKAAGMRALGRHIAKTRAISVLALRRPRGQQGPQPGVSAEAGRRRLHRGAAAVAGGSAHPPLDVPEPPLGDRVLRIDREHLPERVARAVEQPQRLVRAPQAIERDHVLRRSLEDPAG